MTNNNPVAVKINQLPRLVRLICSVSNSWLVGSSADPTNNDPKDYDIAVPFEEWKKVSAHIPKDSKPTLFGGWKFISDGKEVDVWPDDVINIFICRKCDWMWQPKMNIRVVRWQSEG